ncbi:inositol monophosphatase family protein [Fulvivirgaceae bacterium BMA10]|uniref:Inositol-1-monophosphatase n=1 Tax=Splendidivirga corallicola TaxID=3051826 RepID=A0ABT8KUM8_9BACT|nr:inositol monophosphatase family protein [Fulvivirgaceae bacterium BMA10]
MLIFEEILPKALDLTKSVGKFIRKESLSFDRSHIELKGLNDLVSYVDKKAEEQLVNGLKEVLPEAGFITEEGTSNEQSELYNWIIDPLDGTTNFIHGLPVFSISIALMAKREIVLGIVYEINRDECFYASKGSGAFCNDQKIQVSEVSSLSESLLATGFPYYNFEQMNSYLTILDKFMQKTHGLRRLGSAAVDLAYVACGRFEGFFEYNLNAWDVAAGTLIVSEAGGLVTDFDGGNNYLFGREIIAGNKVQPEMLNVIQAQWKP